MNDKFMKEMELVWGNDQSMIDFCIKECFEVVELDNDYIIDIKKPRIQTTFCFGCGQFGNATDEEMEFASMRERNIHQFDNFRKANIEHNFGLLMERVENGKHYMIKFHNGNKLVQIINERVLWNPKEYIVAEITESDRIKIREALNRAIARFDKRLKTYWNRYKDTKLKTWTYITD